MELNYKELGNRIARRRKMLNIKQNAFAAIVGISNNFLSGIERGNERPSLEVLIRICNALKVTPDYLLMGNMHSNNIPQNIIDGLRLCTDEDIDLLCSIVHKMIERREKRWNGDNYV